MNTSEYKEVLERIAQYAIELQCLGKRIDINDVSQPGRLREIMIAKALGHKIHGAKHGHDAESFPEDKIPRKYEYLTCKEGGSFHIDRVDSSNLESRIMKSDWLFCAIFDSDSPIILKEVYIVAPQRFLEECLRKVKNSKPSSRHVSVPLSWVKNNHEVYMTY